MNLMQPNALALEYQRDYGTAHGDLNVFDLVNNPAANGKCHVFGLSLSKQSTVLYGESFTDQLDIVRLERYRACEEALYLRLS